MEAPNGMISQAPQDILKILILQRREDVIENLHLYYKTEARGGGSRLYIIAPSIRSLFFEIQAMMKRDHSEYAELQRVVFDAQSSEQDLINAFFVMNEWLDKKHITKIDTRLEIDRTRVEKVNNARTF